MIARNSLIVLMFLVMSCSKEQSISLNVYPKTLGDVLYIEYKTENLMILTISDVLNRVVYKKELTDLDGRLDIITENFLPGNYIIRVGKSAMMTVTKI